MKRFIFVVIFFMSISSLSAESDIQITSPFFSFFNNINITTKDGYDLQYEKFLLSAFSILQIKNQNYLGEHKIGFYESFSIVNSLVMDYNNYAVHDLGFGGEVSAGCLFKAFENNIIEANCGAGPHLKIFEGGIVLGADSDIQAKFFPKRRCSPVIGTRINFDFFSSQKIYESVKRTRNVENDFYYDSYETYYEYVGHDIKKYLVFYVQPYIAFCVNLN